MSRGTLPIKYDPSSHQNKMEVGLELMISFSGMIPLPTLFWNMP
jgi:hypothetical protein